MKTIALREKTFQILQDIKKKNKAESFDQLITELIIRPNIPDSMFGTLKGKTKKFGEKERREMWKDEI